MSLSDVKPIWNLTPTIVEVDLGSVYLQMEKPGAQRKCVVPYVCRVRYLQIPAYTLSTQILLNNVAIRCAPFQHARACLFTLRPRSGLALEKAQVAFSSPSSSSGSELLKRSVAESYNPV